LAPQLNGASNCSSRKFRRLKGRRVTQREEPPSAATGGGSLFRDAEWLGRRATCVKAKRGNPVELGLLARIFLRLLALLVALIQHFDLLELLECLTKSGFGIVKLHAQFVG
jgi:hypothetical protein